MKKQLQKRKFDYTWVIVALSFLMVFISLGFCSSNKGLYLTAITSALNIKRSAFSLGDSIRFVVTAVLNIFFGALVKKFGTKKLICAGIFLLMASRFLSSIATNIWAFYLDHLLLGIGFSWTSTTMVGCVINKWCKENKGAIMGFIMASNGLGGALAAQIFTPIIYDANNLFGYRTAYRISVLILAVTLVAFLIFFKDKPKGETEELVVTKKKSRGRSWVGIPMGEILKTPYFYSAAICIFFTGFTLQGIASVMTPQFTDVGINASLLASIVSVYSLSLSLCKFGTGFIYDKFGLRTTVIICNIAAVLASLSLALVTSKTVVLAFAAGILCAVALPLETIMLPIYTGDLFGQRSYDHVLGLFVSINVFGYAVGNPVYNLCYDIFGSYKPALYMGAVMMLIVNTALMFVITAAHKKRKEIEKE